MTQMWMSSQNPLYCSITNGEAPVPLPKQEHCPKEEEKAFPEFATYYMIERMEHEPE